MNKRLKEGYENYLKGRASLASMDQQLQSYLGILSHADQYDLSQALINAYWVRDEAHYPLFPTGRMEF